VSKEKDSHVKQHLGIIIDTSRDSTIPEQGLSMLTRDGFYKKDGEQSPQEGFARAATCYSFGDYEFAQRIYDYASKGWYVNASPVLSTAQEINWPTFSEDQFDEAAEWLEENVEADGLPISCFLVKIPDSKKGLAQALEETIFMSMAGGGVGTLNAMRSPDEKSTGVMAHSAVYDAVTLAYKQSKSRRGSIGSYLRIDHPEILQFMSMRDPVGGDQNKKCFNLNNAVVIPDKFMHAMIKGEEYELIDPKHGTTGRFLDARHVWEELMKLRFETGEPYLLFVDNVNKAIPSWIRNPHYIVEQSNLCSEITLWTSEKRSAVCCLSSLNLEKFEEWKDTNIVQDLIRYLDNVLEYFIRLAPPQLKKAIYSARKERALGLGTLGFHSLLQSKGISFEDGGVGGCAQLNNRVYKLIKERAVEESLRLGKIRGEAPDCEGSGMRNSHLMAIAPNASSASLVGASPSIEPWQDNAFMADGRAGAFLIKNKYLEKELELISMNTKEVWKDIIDNNGSIQHLDLPERLKKVFATAREINPMALVDAVTGRQPYVCQSQSFNIFVPKDITMEEMSDIAVRTWEQGGKSMYYCRAESASKASVGTGKDKPLNSVQVRKKIEYDTCVSCEG
jgi:ribonucleoside-diphosphate reductase alpha chain